MARESGLWAWLSKARLHFKLDLHMHRIENPVSPGMPDVEGFLKRFNQFWVELKSASRPARAATPIRFKMRPKQIEWARRRWAIGGACYWLLQVGDGGNRQIYLLTGDMGKDIQRGMTEAELLAHSLLQFTFGDKIVAETVIMAMARGCVA